MIDAIRSILLYDAMQRATRLAKGFAVSDIARGDLGEEAVRGYLRFCIAHQAVEIVPERATRAGRHVILYRATAELPPVLVNAGDDTAIVRKMMIARLLRRRRDNELATKQANMWTALRALRTVEARSLAFHARTETVQISVDTARLYLLRLSLGGYVHIEGDHHFRLSVAKNTGPFPVLAVRGLLFDLNLMRAINVTAQSSLQHNGRAA